MFNRREIIASGLAASFATPALAASLIDMTPVAHASAALRFVADTRFPEARAAARAAEVHGVSIVPVIDLTPLYESLDLAWKRAPFAISGLTTKHTLFVIERLAWERGLRTVYRGFHWRGADGRPRHELLGSPMFLRRLDFASAPDWGTALGEIVWDWTSSPVSHDRVITSQTLPDANGTMPASWLLVPRQDIRRRA